jgi:hypothetical protein
VGAVLRVSPAIRANDWVVSRRKICGVSTPLRIHGFYKWNAQTCKA